MYKKDCLLCFVENAVIRCRTGQNFAINAVKPRISFKQKNEKENFIVDLNRTNGSTYILQNITQKQSSIKICGTNVNWNTLSTDWLR